MAEDLECSLQSAETQMHAILELMDRIHGQFIVASEEFLANWYWEMASELVREKSELTRELGIEKLTEMKAEVRALQAEVSRTVQNLIANQSLWWHLEPGSQEYGCEGNYYPAEMDYAMRLAAGRLAPILEKYGYIKLDLESPGAWRECSKVSLYYFRHSRPYYPKAFEWSPTMKSLMAMYGKLHEEGLFQTEQLEELRGEKTVMEAELLWNQA